MGIFSRKTNIYVSSMTYQLGETDPDALATNTFLAIYTQTPLSAMLKNMALNGMANKVRQVREYAKEEYTLGLPSGSFKTLIQASDSELSTIIAANIGYSPGVVIEHSSVEPLIPFHFVREYLLINRDWDLIENRMGIFPPATLPSGPASASRPTTHTCELTDIEPTSDGTEVTIIYTIKSYQTVYSLRCIHFGPGGYIWDWYPTLFNTQEVTEVLPIPTGYTLSAEYYIVVYKKVTVDGFDPIGYTWYYHIGDNIYPALEKEQDTVDTYSGLPVVPLRYNNVDMTSVAKQDTDLYITSAKLIGKLGLNINDISEKINESPDVAEIDHAYIMFGIDMQTVAQNSIAYLVYFFDKLADEARTSRIDRAHAYLTSGLTVVSGSYGSVNINDPSATSTFSLTEHGLDIQVSYNWVTSELREGRIGNKGFATKEYIRQDPGEAYTTYSYIGTDIRTGLEKTYTGKSYYTWEKSRLILKLQITDNIYQYVEVEGLRQDNRVYTGMDISTTLTNVIDDPDEHNLIVPIDYNIAMQLGILDRNALYEESLQLVMNSVKFVKEKWYQTGWFKMVSFIVMAVLIYLSKGTLGPYLMGIFKSLEAFVTFVLISVIGGYVMKRAFSWLASQIGAEWMAVIGVVIAAVSIYLGYAHPMIHSMTTSQMCLKMSISMVEAGTEELTSQIENIGQEYEQFLLTSSEQMEKLEAAQELLQVDPLGADLLYAQTQQFDVHPLSNDPAMFFALTIHTGNIGTIVLDIIPQWHTVQTTLPTTRTTLGMGSYSPTALA